MASANRIVKKSFSFSEKFWLYPEVYNLCVDSCYKQLEQAGYTNGDDLPEFSFPKVSALKKDYPYLKEADGLGLANSVLDFQKAYKTFRNQKDCSAYRKSALRRDRSGKEPLSFRGLKGFRAFMLNQPDTFRTGLHVSIQRKGMP